MLNMEPKILRGPKALVPKPEVSLGVYLYNKLLEHGPKVAMVDAVTGEERTNDELLTRSLSVAQQLLTLGVKTGDVVGISSENNIDFIVPILAAYYIGATCATLNPAYTKRELHHALHISKPCIVFCSESVVDSVDQVSRESGLIKHIVVFGSPHSHKQIPYARMLQDKSKTFQPFDIDCNNAIAAILCSSGTTGLPKGVMLSHNNILTCFTHMLDPRFSTYAQSDVLLGLLPMFHAYAFVCLLLSIVRGFKVVVMKKFEDELFLRTIQDHKITLLFLVPPLIVFLAKHPLVDKYDLSSVREIRCGAAPLSEEVEALVVKRLGIEEIRQGYGMTETTLGVTFSTPFENRSGSAGPLAPDMECKVIDVDTGKLLGPYEKGELCFKGPLIMKGYCGDVQATAATFDQDGFLHTGDVGYYDKDGFFYIVDRVKELIKYKGFQVPPAELEAILLTHPAVKDVGVVGKPDEVAGELPMGFVVKQIGKNVTEEELVQFVAKQVSPQKRLRGGVIFVDAIPKTPSGKILRRDLRLMLKSKL